MKPSFNRFGEERVTTSMLYSTSRVARVFNPWVFGEDTSKRSKNAKIFQDPDTGQNTAVLTIHHQHYEDDDHILDDVVEDFELSDLTGWIHAAKRVRHAVYIGPNGERRWYPRRNTTNEYADFGRLQYWTGSAWQNVELGTPDQTGNTITWSTTDFDLILVHGWRTNKASVVLKTETARNKIRWAVDLNGLEWNNWELISSSEQVRTGIINAPIAWDATQDPTSREFIPNVAVTPTYASGYIEFGGDWSAAQLPITIDPTFSDGYGGDVTTYKDTWINVNAPTTNNGTHIWIIFGNYAEIYYINQLLEFDVSSIVGNNTVTTATLTLYRSGGGYGTDFDVGFYRLLVPWVEAEATWNIRSTGNNWSTAGAKGSGTDHAVSADLTANVVKAWVDESAHDFILTSGVQAWVDGTSNYGWVIIPTEAVNESEIYFYSSDAGSSLRPKLVVVYTAAATGPVGTESRQAQVSDAATLGVITPITPAQGNQAQVSDAPTVRAITSIAVAQNFQSQVSDAATIGVIHPIAPAQANQAQVSDAAGITFQAGGIEYPITPAQSNQAQMSDAATFGVIHPIAPAQANQVQVSDAATLSAGETTVTVAQANQAQVSDAAILGVIYPVVVTDSRQAQVSDAAGITFSGIGVVNITPADSNQAQTSDTAVLGVYTVITPAQANQVQVSDAVSISAQGPTYAITVADANQAQVSDTVMLGVYYPVTVADSFQAQVSDPALLSLGGIIDHGERRLYDMKVRSDSVFATRPTHSTGTRVDLEVDDGD